MRYMRACRVRDSCARAAVSCLCLCWCKTLHAGALSQFFFNFASMRQLRGHCFRSFCLICVPAVVSAGAFVSVSGDPGMRSAQPRLLLEGWNFCNRCGRSCEILPRWADCVAANGTQLVSKSANAAGLPVASQDQPRCDAGAEQKERDLGQLCEQVRLEITVDIVSRRC